MNSWLFTLLSKTHNTQITIQISDLLLRIFHFLYFRTVVNLVARAVAAGAVKLTATGNCKSESWGTQLHRLDSGKCGFILRKVLPARPMHDLGRGKGPLAS